VTGRAIVLWAAGTLVLASPAVAQTRSVIGQSGILGEWEIAATVTKQAGGQRWNGPVSLKHTGFCSVDGPEEKTGELSIVMSDPATASATTLLIDGTACTFKGRLTGEADGVLVCPDRPDVPMTLELQ